MGVRALVAVMMAMLAGTAGIAAYIWWALGDVEISRHGIIALVAGVLATLAVGVGLMWLVFYSHRRGYDDEAG